MSSFYSLLDMGQVGPIKTILPKKNPLGQQKKMRCKSPVGSQNLEHIHADFKSHLLRLIEFQTSRDSLFPSKNLPWKGSHYSD